MVGPGTQKTGAADRKELYVSVHTVNPTAGIIWYRVGPYHPVLYTLVLVLEDKSYLRFWIIYLEYIYFGY